MHRILVDHYQCSPDIIKDRIPLSDGSLSRFLGTDWEVEFHRRGVFDELFLAGDDDPTGWALSTADAILSGAGGSPDDSLEAFYRWLHDSVCASPDNPVLPGRLPGHRPFSMKAALFLLDGLARIQTHRIFHTDTQLNLETMLLRLLQEME